MPVQECFSPWWTFIFASALVTTGGGLQVVMVDTFASLGLALSLPFAFPLGIDLTGPEKLVLSHLLQGPLERGPIGHQLTDLSPCIPLCPQQGSLSLCKLLILEMVIPPFRGRRFPSSNLGAIKPVIPFIKVTLVQIKLLELRKGQHTHEEVIAENCVHPLAASAGSAVLLPPLLSQIHQP